MFASARLWILARHATRAGLLCLSILAPALAAAAGGTLIDKTLTSIPGGDNFAHRAVVQPDGKLVIVGAAHFGTMQYQITRYNADGTLDTAFGNGGTVLEPLGPGNGEAWAVGLQPDGKIVVAGFVTSDTTRIGIARFNADGTLDTSFGGGGAATTVGPADAGGYAMAILANGQILVGGYSRGATSKKVFTILRYNADATIDTAFGSGGVATTPEASGDEVLDAMAIQSDGKIITAGTGNGYLPMHRFNADGSIDTTWGSTSYSGVRGGNDLAIQPDGKVVIAASMPYGGTSALAVLRMSAGGSPDATFGPGNACSPSCPGVAAMSVGDNASGWGIALQADGSIAISGNTVLAAGAGNAVVIGRFTSTGAIDTSFGTNGATAAQPSGNQDTGYGIATRADGRFLVAGSALGLHNDLDSLVVGFTTDGAIDTSFNTGGFARLDAGTMPAQAKASVLQPDGKLVVSGLALEEQHTAAPPVEHGVLARYLANGTLDSSFGTNGVTLFGWRPNAVALQGNGSIVVGGYALTDQGGSSVPSMAFGRFLANGTFDTSFGTAGETLIAPATSDEEINAIAIQPDGKIVGGGLQISGTFSDALFARVTATGALDTTFNGSGKVAVAMSTGNDRVNGIALQADGKIVGAGWAEVSGDQDSFAATRINTDGTVDSAFGASGTATINFTTNTSHGNAVVLQPDGEIVIGGQVHNGATDDFALARLTTAGALDAAFGSGGLASNDFGSHNRIFALALLSSGKIVGAGEDGGTFAVVQYLSNGTVDTSFGTGGNASIPVNAGADVAAALSVAADGTLYVSGNASGVFGLIRVTGDSGAPAKANPTVTLSSSLNPSNAGQGVTLTAAVTGTAGSPTGTVNFVDGTTSITGCAAVTISVGSAACTTTGLAAGSHSITAQYAGDVNYNSATSNTVTQGVNGTKATPSVSLGSSVNPSTPGQSVTFTANVSGSAGTATGALNFLDGASSIAGCASVAMSSGSATCMTSGLAAGNHSISAQYSGDSAYNGASSGTITQSVQTAGGPSTNVALASAGAVATASSQWDANYPASAVIDGDRAGHNYGAGGVWSDATRDAFPDWIQVQFPAANTIDHVVVYSMQDNYNSPVEPSDAMTFTYYGATAFDVQSWNGSAWVTVASVTGNTLVKRTVTFTPVSTDRIRVVVNAAKGRFSLLSEVEVWSAGSAPPASVNVALASAGASAIASSQWDANYPASAVINGNRAGAGYGSGGVWSDSTRDVFPDSIQVLFSGTKTIDHVVVYSMQDNYSSPVDPSDVMTFNFYGATAFDVQAWNGSAWVTVGSVTGNNLVKRAVTFTPITTDQVRVVVNAAKGRYSLLTEVEIWGQ